MGSRGPIRKSAELRVLEGQRAHRPLPAPSAPSGFGLMPERPKGMTAGARRVWDAYFDQMLQLGILRPVDAFALQRLCEDVALLQELQGGMRKLANETKREAKAAGRKLPGGGMIELSMSHEGRRLSATINALATRVGRQELQFGLTPISAQRLGEGVGGGAMLPPEASDSIEARLCG